MKNLFKNLFKKEYKPEDFRLQIVPSWFSPDYVEFKYSRNKGKTWEYIHRVNRVFDDENYKWERLCYPLGSGDFSHKKEKFSTYEKIKAYEDEQERKGNEKNKQLEEERQRARERRAEALRKANS